jgi:AcrR family transcriptional regulator
MARKTTGFERIKQQKKQNILQAALNLIKKYGIKKVNIYDIAREAEVSQVTIYSHFGSKENLIREAVKLFLEEYIENFVELMKSEMPYLKKLEMIVFEKNQIISRYGGEFTHAMYTNDPEMKAYMDRYMNDIIIPMTLNLLHQGKREGYINKNLADESIMAYLQIIRSGYSDPEVLAFVSQKPRILKDLISLYFYGFDGEQSRG